MALLVQLRWTAVIGQIATVAFVETGLDIPLPTVPMLGVIGALVVLNLVSHAWIARRNAVSHRELLFAMVFDVAALTAQLYLSGGATNPFASLYLLQVTLGAVLLDTRSAWFLVALTCASLAGLTVFYRPLPAPLIDTDHASSLYIAGMFIGLALDAVLLVVFVTRINRNLRQRDARLAALRQHAAEEEHVVRMGLLASGAAHELGTPLASMSVIINDWQHMPRLMAAPDIAEDIIEMEASLKRCKSIVTGILLSAGEARGEGSSPTTVNKFLGELVDSWRSARTRPLLAFDNQFGNDVAIVSDAVLTQAVFNLLDNAIEASPSGIELVAMREGESLVLNINDDGPGFATEMLSQLGKPYNSSKGRPGRGLGLFLVVNVVRKLGGKIMAHNRLDGGATVSLILPLKALEIESDYNG